MLLTFADTPNMVAYLNKSDASEGFNQVIDFLNGIYIKYDLTINPHIYASCIKQLWNTVVVKQTNDITRLQALVDKKKVMIMEATIRDALRLNDEEGVDCLPNEEIFAKLARMGYEKSSTKLTFYNSAMASAVICLSNGRNFNFSKYIFDKLVRNVDSSSKFYMYPRFIQLIIQNQLGDLSTHTTKYISPALTQKVFANMRRVEKGCLGVETPLFEGMLVAKEPEEQCDSNEEVQGNDNDIAQGADTAVSGDDVQDQSIPSPTLPTSPPQPPQDIPSTSQEVVEVVTTAKLITEVVAAVSESVSAASATIAAVPAATITVAPVRVAAASTRRRKGVVIRDPEEESKSTAKTPTETKSKDNGKG
nr:hypothetical protein [Tanacetum cinerariifolium]